MVSSNGGALTLAGMKISWLRTLCVGYNGKQLGGIAGVWQLYYLMSVPDGHSKQPDGLLVAAVLSK